MTALPAPLPEPQMYGHSYLCSRARAGPPGEYREANHQRRGQGCHGSAGGRRDDPGDPAAAGRAAAAAQNRSACSWSARTTWASPTSSTRSRSPRSPGCPARPARWPWCRRAGWPPARCSTAPRGPRSGCPTWSPSATRPWWPPVTCSTTWPGTRTPRPWRCSSRRSATRRRLPGPPAAHSGATAGDDHQVDGFLHDLGVIRVEEIEDLILTTGAAAHLGRLARPGIGVVSISGGACDMLADHAASLGAPLPALAPATRAELARILPDYGTVQNPLDITGAAVIDPGIFTRAIEAMSADPSVGVVAVINGLPWQRDGRPWPGQVLADAIGAARATTPVVCVSQVMQPITGYTREVMARAGIPYVIPGLRHCVAALRNVGWWSQGHHRGPGPGA